ncbi:hypothetical protein ACH4GP_16850 [Streptomyces celluloflavus]|uniref:Uncharacterized protein n=1 Tax=Streptomyces celluloflavus TaxID=58344 RepID=A0ABW7RDB8_9ACTN
MAKLKVSHRSETRSIPRAPGSDASDLDRRHHDLHEESSHYHPDAPWIVVSICGRRSSR